MCVAYLSGGQITFFFCDIGRHDAGRRDEQQRHRPGLRGRHEGNEEAEPGKTNDCYCLHICCLRTSNVEYKLTTLTAYRAVRTI